jgi:hypothetical protein
MEATALVAKQVENGSTNCKLVFLCRFFFYGVVCLYGQLASCLSVFLW